MPYISRPNDLQCVSEKSTHIDAYMHTHCSNAHTIPVFVNS